MVRQSHYSSTIKCRSGRWAVALVLPDFAEQRCQPAHTLALMHTMSDLEVQVDRSSVPVHHADAHKVCRTGLDSQASAETGFVFGFTTDAGRAATMGVPFGIGDMRWHSGPLARMTVKRAARPWVTRKGACQGRGKIGQRMLARGRQRRGVAW